MKTMICQTCIRKPIESKESLTGFCKYCGEKIWNMNRTFIACGDCSKKYTVCQCCGNKIEL